MAEAEPEEPATNGAEEAAEGAGDVDLGDEDDGDLLGDAAPAAEAEPEAEAEAESPKAGDAGELVLESAPPGGSEAAPPGGRPTARLDASLEDIIRREKGGGQWDGPPPGRQQVVLQPAHGAPPLGRPLPPVHQLDRLGPAPLRGRGGYADLGPPLRGAYDPLDPRLDPRGLPPSPYDSYRYGLGSLPPRGLPPPSYAYDLRDPLRPRPLDPRDRLLDRRDLDRRALDLDRRSAALARSDRADRALGLPPPLPPHPFDRVPLRDPLPPRGDPRDLGPPPDKGKGKGDRAPRMSHEELTRKAVRNTKISLRRDGVFAVKLYNTDVVQIPEQPVGTAILHSGGFKTLETLTVINEALEPFGFKIREFPPNSRHWEVAGYAQQPQMFTDGMVIHETARFPITAALCERKMRHLIDAYAPPRPTRPPANQGRRSRSRSREQRNGPEPEDDMEDWDGEFQ